MTPSAAPVSPFKDSCTRTDGLPAVPLVLGVVGDERADRGLRTSLEKTFLEFQDAYPNTPIVVMTALATAGERLAAETALTCGLFVRVPLPADFARSRVEALHAHPDKHRIESSFIVPLPKEPAPPNGWDTEANAGGYLVRRCHALIAVCAGNPDRLSPRVAEFVACKLEGKAFTNYPWIDKHPLGFRGDRGPVIVLHPPDVDFVGEDPGLPTADAVLLRRIRVPAHAGPDPEETAEARPDESLPQRVHWLRHLLHRLCSAVNLCHPSERQQFRDICQAVDDFNADVLDSCKLADIRREVANAGKNPPGLDLIPRLLPEPFAGWYVRMRGACETADYLSQELQPIENAAVLSIFCMLFAFLVLFHFYAHPPLGGHDHHREFLAGSLVPLLVAGIIVIAAWGFRVDERRLDYRALAESLRVRCYWALGGIGVSVADSYLGQLRGEMIWARLALQHLAPPPQTWAEQFDGLTKEQQLERLEFVHKAWVRDQRDYMHRAHKRAHKSGTRFRVLGFILFILGVASMAGLLPMEHNDHRPHNWIIITVPMVVIVSGLLVAYSERRSYEELAKQYSRMYVVFNDGDIELTAALAAGNIARAQAVLASLGHEAISEHAQWVILRRARPVELQLGG